MDFKQKDKRHWTGYLPVEAAPRKDGLPVSINQLRVSVFHSNNRYTLDAAPVEDKDGFVRCVLSDIEFFRLETAPRFNAKTLIGWVLAVQSHITNREGEYWEFVSEVMAKHGLTTVPQVDETLEALPVDPSQTLSCFV